ncbi:MAG: methylamine dehydrogenase accessory protein MauD [Pseudomonadales bacterium]
MDSLLVASSIVLWIAVIVLTGLVYALSRQVAALFRRVAPAGALMVNQQISAGAPAPRLVLEDIDGVAVDIGAPSAAGVRQLLLFVDPDCPICAALLPAARDLARAERKLQLIVASDGDDAAPHRALIVRAGLRGLPYVLSETLGRSYGVGKVPYGVLIDAEGRLAALGIVNSREHLESLLNAEEQGVASLQDYLARDATRPLPTGDST